MVYFLQLHKLRDDPSTHQVEMLMVQTRIRLLKIPEVMNLRCGKKIDPKASHDFFLAFDVENMSKLKMVQEHAHFIQLNTQTLAPASRETLTHIFELEPVKDVRYS